nr:helix-turn-helix transcriptional regulator [uncultured Fibrobacter sp.]
MDYVTNIRIDYAKQLLEQTNLSLTEICSKVGYSDQSTFFRAFKKITKETPAQYKRRIKQ